MTGSPWALAALVCWHLGSSGGLPKEIPVDQVRPYATGERQVRVLAFEGATQVTMRPGSAASVENAGTGERLGVVGAGATVELTVSQGRAMARAGSLRAGGERVTVRPLSAGAATVVSARGGVGRRGAYHGAFEVTVNGGRLRVVERVDLEEYVAGVVGAELPRSFPRQAFEAQAVAARTYALYHLGDHAGQGADLCAQVHCQAYAGEPRADSPAAAAARATAGEVLVWNGLLLDALYHSACGGATATAWEVRQGKLLPYLRTRSDIDWRSPAEEPYCDYDHSVAWTRRVSHAEASRLVRANLGTVLGRQDMAPGGLVSLDAARYAGTRLQWLEVKTTTGTYLVRGDAIRWLFGTGRPGAGGLRSTSFTLTVERGRGGGPTSYLFRGVGHGHGIGLCQWGARGRAAAGQSATEILMDYYPGAEVLSLHGR